MLEMLARLPFDILNSVLEDIDNYQDDKVRKEKFYYEKYSALIGHFNGFIKKYNVVTQNNTILEGNLVSMTDSRDFYREDRDAKHRDRNVLMDEFNALLSKSEMLHRGLAAHKFVAQSRARDMVQMEAGLYLLKGALECALAQPGLSASQAQAGLECIHAGIQNWLNRHHLTPAGEQLHISLNKSLSRLETALDTWHTRGEDTTGLYYSSFKPFIPLSNVKHPDYDHELTQEARHELQRPILQRYNQARTDELVAILRGPLMALSQNHEMVASVAKEIGMSAMGLKEAAKTKTRESLQEEVKRLREQNVAQSREITTLTRDAAQHMAQAVAFRQQLEVVDPSNPYCTDGHLRQRVAQTAYDQFARTDFKDWTVVRNVAQTFAPATPAYESSAMREAQENLELYAQESEARVQEAKQSVTLRDKIVAQSREIDSLTRDAAQHMAQAVAFRQQLELADPTNPYCQDARLRQRVAQTAYDQLARTDFKDWTVVRQVAGTFADQIAPREERERAQAQSLYSGYPSGS